MRKAKSFVVLFPTLILVGLGCGAQQDTDSNEHVVEMVSALSSCGLRCPTGYHPTSYPWSISCCGTGGCGGIYSNSVTCEPNSGSAFLTCGSGCPTGYVPTSYEWSISCCNASGCGGITNNSTRCDCIRGLTCPPPPPPPPPCSISATPTTVLVPAGGLGKTHICWNSDVSWSQVYVSMDGAPDSLMAMERYRGCVDPGWIQGGHSYEFRLYDGKAHAAICARVTVTGVVR